VDRVRQRLAPRLKAAGYAGVRARVQLTLNEAWARRLAIELDRHTPRHDILAAFAETLTDITTGVIVSLYADERTRDQLMEIARDMITTAWARSIDALMTYDEREPLDRIGFHGCGDEQGIMRNPISLHERIHTADT
jgi:hypothetical protein